MKPAPFEYHRAYTPKEVTELLLELGEDAKILAGGQSLVPMMNFRLARPTALVDINPVSGLDYIRRDGDVLRVGALTRHRSVELSTEPDVHNGFSVLPGAARWIGHFPIRSRGTVGGSIAHADPTAEWCLLARLYDAEIVVLGEHGTRTVPSDEWFTGFLTTAALPGELVLETRFRRPRRHGTLLEYARRRGDFAIAAVAVAFDITDNRCHDVSMVLGGVANEPLRVPEAEAYLEGAEPGERAWAEAARLAAEAVTPGTGPDDGDHGYRRQLVGTLARRALAEAQAGPAGPRPRGGAS